MSELRVCYDWLLLRQDPDGLRVVSRHRSRANGSRRLAGHRSREPGRLFALVQSFGGFGPEYPHAGTRRGDLVHAEGIDWRGSARAAWRPTPRGLGCSECCDNSRPDSLAYRCPILRGSPLCEVVAVLTGRDGS